MILAADNLHPMDPQIAHAIENMDPKPIRALVKSCESRGADLIDINPGYLSSRREDRMTFLLETVQDVTDLGLILDSPNPKILKKGLECCRKRPILNALSLERTKIDEILPLAAEHKTGLIILLMDERSFTPATLEEKLAIAIELREMCVAAGLAMDDLYFDPVLPNLSWDDAYFRISQGLETIRLLSTGSVFQEAAQTVVGLSNLRSGVTRQYSSNLDQTVLAMLAGAGLTMLLANIMRQEILDTYRSVVSLDRITSLGVNKPI